MSIATLEIMMSARWLLLLLLILVLHTTASADERADAFRDLSARLATVEVHANAVDRTLDQATRLPNLDLLGIAGRPRSMVDPSLARIRFQQVRLQQRLQQNLLRQRVQAQRTIESMRLRQARQVTRLRNPHRMPGMSRHSSTRRWSQPLATVTRHRMQSRHAFRQIRPVVQHRRPRINGSDLARMRSNSARTFRNAHETVRVMRNIARVAVDANFSRAYGGFGRSVSSIRSHYASRRPYPRYTPTKFMLEPTKNNLALAKRWHKGSFTSPLQNLSYHYAKHSIKAGTSARQYTRDALRFHKNHTRMRNAGVRNYRVKFKAYADGSMRYKLSKPRKMVTQGYFDNGRIKSFLNKNRPRIGG